MSKGKGRPITCHWRRWIGVGCQRHAPAAFSPRKRPDTHCTGGRVDLRIGLDGCRRILLQPGFEFQTIQPVANLFFCEWPLIIRVYLTNAEFARELLHCVNFFEPRAKKKSRYPNTVVVYFKPGCKLHHLWVQTCIACSSPIAELYETTDPTFSVLFLWMESIFFVQLCLFHRLEIKRLQINSHLNEENGFSCARLFILQINFGYNVKSFQFYNTGEGQTFLDPLLLHSSTPGITKNVVLAPCQRSSWCL
jgi:hypothetical protein